MTNVFRLHMLGLPVIQNMDDFTEKTHISKYTLFQLSRNSDKYYKIYTIPKKSGKLRTICQPSKKLKGLQAWILVNILNKLKVSDSCRGFEKGSSIAENASAHIGANTILNLDLKDFFSTINQKQVFNIFKSIGYNNTISVIFSNICTYNQKLPQGSPCSPKLANLCSWRLDVRIQGYVGKRGIIYTRYADDMSFSGNSPNNVTGIISVIGRIINSENFSLNKSKTRVAGRTKARIVTGLVLSDNTYGIGKQKYKILRAKIHHLTLIHEQENFKLLSEVKGYLAFLNSTDKVRYKRIQAYIKNLSSKHKESLISLLLKSSAISEIHAIKEISV